MKKPILTQNSLEKGRELDGTERGTIHGNFVLERLGDGELSLI